MRLGNCMAIGLLLFTLNACADDKFPVLKVGDDTYSNVTVLTVTSTDICFKYPGGIANVKLKDLSPELQKHFHYNATTAQETEKNQIDANARYYETIDSQPKVSPPNEDRPAPKPGAAPAADGMWRTDLPGALAQAKSENKLVLLDFTGSDWCRWCMKFEHDIIETDQFTKYANQKLVLVKLDFPSKTPQDPDLKKANAALAKQFDIHGYPTYVLLDANGKELGRQVGYVWAGVSAFIAELDKFSR